MRNKIIALAILASLSGSAMAENTANFQASATLNPTCTIKTPASDVVMFFLPALQKQGITGGSGGTNLTLTCTKNTTVSVALSPNTPYQTGDDPYTILESINWTPRGTLTGSNPENKLAYVLRIYSISTSGNMQVNPNGDDSLTGSYATTESGQDVVFGLGINIRSNGLAAPDTYKDNVTINISY